ncbi:ferritin [Anaerococcus sp. AGMB00486]|uniref:Ferritin n=2 Tax=Anaerococcus TaxID=165779 RepID=A0ABX2NBR1_9FIRM|nr:MULTISPECIES: ferritin [Anaerococcus]MDY3006614.1 ferritin [Anaerococcus porci]MSS78084.1 ferritin [Anaerococcus porci]NVF12113.1 ferritin [Anaerococcus faecalis]
MSEKLLDMLNEQMNFELQSAYEYKAMQIFAYDIEFDGFAYWFGKQVKEELEHALKIEGFLLEVGYKPLYKALEQPENKFEDLLDVAKVALDHEKEVTRRIHEIAKAAREEGDERVISFIKWFVDEQVEEEDNFGKLVTRLERINGNYGGLYILDGQLAKRG